MTPGTGKRLKFLNCSVILPAGKGSPSNPVSSVWRLTERPNQKCQNWCTHSWDYHQNLAGICNQVHTYWKKYISTPLLTNYLHEQEWLKHQWKDVLKAKLHKISKQDSLNLTSISSFNVPLLPPSNLLFTELINSQNTTYKLTNLINSRDFSLQMDKFLFPIYFLRHT